MEAAQEINNVHKYPLDHPVITVVVTMWSLL